MEKKRFEFKKVVTQGEKTSTAPTKFWMELSAPRVVLCSQFIDLRDERDRVMATLTFTSEYTVEEAQAARAA